MIKDVLNVMLPQICLLVFIFVELILAMCMPKEKNLIAKIISATGITLSILLLSTVQTEPQYFAFHGSIMSDIYTLLFQFIILLCGFFIVLLVKNQTETANYNAYSFQALILTALFGAVNVISSNDFLTMFVSLELLSFPLYFLIASSNGYLSKEASFKYLITNAISIGVFLFGVSYLYGLTSTLNFTELYEYVVDKETTILYIFSTIVIVLGLFAKLAVFPFANWVVDVYKGTDTCVLAFLSTVPKLALFGVLCRLLVFPLRGDFELTLIIIIMSLITALWANTYAIRENNIKAVMACSSAANAAYMLFTAGIVSVYNLSAVIFYLICYVLMNIAVFSYLNILEKNNIKLEVTNIKGLFNKNKLISICYAIAVIGLAGFPITSGFVIKVYLLSAIAQSGLIFVPFLLILLILMVVALYYYLKIIQPIFEQEDNSIVLQTSFSQKFVLLMTSFVTVLLGIYPEILIELCRFIAYNI